MYYLQDYTVNCPWSDRTSATPLQVTSTKTSSMRTSGKIPMDHSTSSSCGRCGLGRRASPYTAGQKSDKRDCDGSPNKMTAHQFGCCVATERNYVECNAGETQKEDDEDVPLREWSQQVHSS
jgi:hypothetical protein